MRTVKRRKERRFHHVVFVAICMENRNMMADYYREFILPSLEKRETWEIYMVYTCESVVALADRGVEVDVVIFSEGFPEIDRNGLWEYFCRSGKIVPEFLILSLPGLPV